MNCHIFIPKIYERTVSTVLKALDYSVFGHPVTKLQLIDSGIERRGLSPPYSKIVDMAGIAGVSCIAKTTTLRFKP